MSANQITTVFFDLGDTLGTAVLSPPPIHLVDFNVFPFSRAVLTGLRDDGLRLGVISNTGDDTGSSVNAVLRRAGLLDFFDPALLIYSRDVGVTKATPAIFQVAAARAGLADAAARCLYVGEDAKERGSALDAGWSVAPHPLLVREAIAAAPLPVRPHHRSSRACRIRLAIGSAQYRAGAAVRATGHHGSTIYAVTSLRLLPQLMNMRFEVELLGSADAPLRTELYILRDDAAAGSGFLSAGGSRRAVSAIGRMRASFCVRPAKVSWSRCLRSVRSRNSTSKPRGTVTR